MQRFVVETRLEPSTLSYNYNGGMLSTRIRMGSGLDGKELCHRVELGGDAMDAEMLNYVLDHHVHSIKKFILDQAADQLYKESPEYQKMKRQIDEANEKLDDISDIADPDDRL